MHNKETVNYNILESCQCKMYQMHSFICCYEANFNLKIECGVDKSCLLISELILFIYTVGSFTICTIGGIKRNKLTNAQQCETKNVANFF